MTEFEVQKLRSAMLFILNKQGSMGYYHLFKILYFADREHTAEYGRRIINDTFCAFPDGPVPSVLYDIIKGNHGWLEKDKYASIIDSFTKGSESGYYFISPSIPADESYLSKSDIECLNKSYNEHISMKYDELKEKSHDEAWDEAWERSSRPNNPMEYLLSAKSAGANNEMIEHIKEMDAIADYLMTN